MNDEKIDFTGLYEAECGYFDDRTAHEEIYLLPNGDFNQQMHLFDEMLSDGFRRSGTLIYRASCPDCKKCIPIRIRPENFTFNKHQRYLLKKNSDIFVSISSKKCDMVNAEKIALMKKYNLRHDPDKIQSDSEVRDMLLQMNGFMDIDGIEHENPVYCGTINMDYRIGDRLVGVGLIDFGANSLSSNYFYYDTSEDIMKRSIGTFTILMEIKFCKEHNVPFYYLGYYLSQCRKMNYKGKFLPHELLIEGEWFEQKEQNFDV